MEMRLLSRSPHSAGIHVAPVTSLVLVPVLPAELRLPQHQDRETEAAQPSLAPQTLTPAQIPAPGQFSPI